MIRDYIIEFSRDEATGAYTATMPRLGLAATHANAEQATRLVRKAARDWIAGARASGTPVPEPEDLNALVMERRPRISIFWSEEDQVFLAEAPDLTGCMTDGATYEKALKNLLEAMGLWLYQGDSDDCNRLDASLRVENPQSVEFTEVA